MGFKQSILLTSLLVVAIASPVRAQLKKVRFSVSAASIAEVPFRIAHVKGFYRDEGLDVEVIMIRGAVGMQALLGGSVDYTSSSGSTIAAAVRGIPVKLVFIASAKPQFDLVVQPQIRTVQDLKGKVVGISSRGGAVDLLMQLLLQKNGLVPNKDVTSYRRRRPRRNGSRPQGRSHRRGAVHTTPAVAAAARWFYPACLYRRLHADLSKRWNRRHRGKNQNEPSRSPGVRQRKRARPTLCQAQSR